MQVALPFVAIASVRRKPADQSARAIRLKNVKRLLAIEVWVGVGDPPTCPGAEARAPVHYGHNAERWTGSSRTFAIRRTGLSVRLAIITMISFNLPTRLVNVMQRSPKSPANLYRAEFHADRDARTRAAARTILSYIFDWCQINSVCDVGCGVGTWLAAAQGLGAGMVTGYEGPWGASAQLVVDPALVEFLDLEQPISAGTRFDLVVSLEVAEHLSPARGPGLVADLCRLGNMVLFAAAIPNQGGTGHVNERWQSYWAGLFDSQDYDVIDAIRPLIWQNGEIPWWYRQNILLYVRRQSPAATALAVAGLPATSYIDLVHPDHFIHAEEHQPGRAIKKMVRRLLNRGG